MNSATQFDSRINKYPIVILIQLTQHDSFDKQKKTEY